jgi:YD repeat-containing protein
MGRINGQTYETPSLNFNWLQAFNITYDLAGHITSFSYPDGRTVNQTWDAGGHLNQIADSSGG